jgi:hypothetical protein
MAGAGVNDTPSRWSSRERPKYNTQVLTMAAESILAVGDASLRLDGVYRHIATATHRILTFGVPLVHAVRQTPISDETAQNNRQGSACPASLVDCVASPTYRKRRTPDLSQRGLPWGSPRFLNLKTSAGR